jgi:hypothetical protein
VAAVAGTAETCPGAVIVTGVTAPGIGEAIDHIAAIDPLIVVIAIEAAIVILIEAAVMVTHHILAVITKVVIMHQQGKQPPLLKRHQHNKQYNYLAVFLCYNRKREHLLPFSV